MPELGSKKKREDRDAATNAGPHSAALPALIKKAKRGDRAALYELCDKSVKLAYFLALRLVDNEADAEDVMQDSLLYVCQKIGELRDPAAYTSWLSRITISMSREFYKKNAKHGATLDIDDYLEKIAESNAEFLPEEYAESEENREAIVTIIDSLPMRQREAVVLCYYGGLSVTEAAREMGVDKANVSQYLKLAREKLRAGMETKDLTPPSGPMKLYSAGLTLLALLNREAGLLTLNSAVSKQAMQKCGAAIEAKGTPLLAGVGGARAAFLPSAMVAVMIATLVVTFFFSVLRWPRKTTPGLAAAAPSLKAAESAIVFTGGEDPGAGNAYRNPTAARPADVEGGGPVTVAQWWITPAGGESLVLFSGTGNEGALEDAFAALSEEGGGAYVVWFSLRNQAGLTYRGRGDFHVEEK